MNLYSFKSKMTGLLLMVFLLGSQSCQIDEVADPNGPSVFDVENNATLADMLLMVTGVESSMRTDVGYYYENVGILGREFYRLTNSDPRYTTDLPGANGSALDNNTFYTTRPYNARYACIRNCQILMNAVNNNTTGVTDAQRNGFLGFAQTVQAYQLLLVANLQYNNGIRVDVTDPNNLGPFVGEGSPNTIYANIEERLANAVSLLENGEFVFSLSTGFNDLVSDPDVGLTAEDFIQFNKAIAARVAIYQGRKTEALTHLAGAAPLFDRNGDYSTSVDHVFTEGSGDQTNPLFYTPNGPDNNCANYSFRNDAETGDPRPDSKLIPRSDTLVIPGTGLSGIDDVRFETRTAPIHITRNEELVLLYAEANIGSNNALAAEVLDEVRARYGLAAATYTNTPPSDEELVTQLLHEKRYSLFAEGHRWIDMRRYNRLDELPIDQAGGSVHVQFPRPASEAE